jgi:hypothetical protein
MLEELMADHGEVEYATAEGNDLPAHSQLCGVHPFTVTGRCDHHPVGL